MTSAEIIDSILIKRGMSRRQLALKSGLSPSSLQSAMQRNSSMSFNMLIKIANTLGVDWLELVPQEEQGPLIRQRIKGKLAEDSRETVSKAETLSDKEKLLALIETMEQDDLMDCIDEAVKMLRQRQAELNDIFSED